MHILTCRVTKIYLISFPNVIALGYVHTIPDRFLIHFKSCSGTVWTRINVLLWCRNCSEAFPVWTQDLSIIKFERSLLIWKDHLLVWGSIAISAPIKVFKLDSDCFTNLSNTELSTFNSGTEQYCFGGEPASKAGFLVWTEVLSGTLSATLRFTILYSVDTPRGGGGDFHMRSTWGCATS